MCIRDRGRIVGLLGSPGGSRIINYVAETLLALLAWNLSPAEAAALPHFGSRNGPTELERGTSLEALRPQLEKLGHEVKAVSYTHLRAHETVLDLVCRLLLEKKKS